MRRGSDRSQRPPRVGAAMLAKALVGVFVVFLCAGGASAAAGYFQFRKIVDVDLPEGVATPEPIQIPEEEALPEVKPGGPRTLLVLGSDRRDKRATDAKLGFE